MLKLEPKLQLMYLMELIIWLQIHWLVQYLLLRKLVVQNSIIQLILTILYILPMVPLLSLLLMLRICILN